MDLYFKPITRATSRKQVSVIPDRKDNNVIHINDSRYDKNKTISLISSFLFTSMAKDKKKSKELSFDKGVDSVVMYDMNDYTKQLTSSLDNKKTIYLLTNQYEMRSFLKSLEKGKISDETKTSKEKK